MRARYDKPGTIQRMSIAHTSEVDREVAYASGKYAVDLFKKGESGVEVVIEKGGFSSVALDKIAEVERLLPDEFMNKDRDFITDAFKDYALPLIGDNIPDFGRIYAILSS